VLGTQVLEVDVKELRALYAQAFGKPF
jgi:hypothetical protein